MRCTVKPAALQHARRDRPARRLRPASPRGSAAGRGRWRWDRVWSCPGLTESHGASQLNGPWRAAARAAAPAGRGRIGCRRWCRAGSPSSTMAQMSMAKLTTMRIELSGAVVAEHINGDQVDGEWREIEQRSHQPLLLRSCRRLMPTARPEIDQRDIGDQRGDKNRIHRRRHRHRDADHAEEKYDVDQSSQPEFCAVDAAGKAEQQNKRVHRLPPIRLAAPSSPLRTAARPQPAGRGRSGSAPMCRAGSPSRRGPRSGRQSRGCKRCCRRSRRRRLGADAVEEYDGSDAEQQLGTR